MGAREWAVTESSRKAKYTRSPRRAGSSWPRERRTGNKLSKACTRFCVLREVSYGFLPSHLMGSGQTFRLDREIEDELREHMRMCIDANVAKGMSPEEAGARRGCALEILLW